MLQSWSTMINRFHCSLLHTLGYPENECLWQENNVLPMYHLLLSCLRFKWNLRLPKLTRKQSFILACPKPSWISWNTFSAFHWNIINTCMLQVTEVGECSVPRSSQTESNTARLWALKDQVFIFNKTFCSFILGGTFGVGPHQK